MATNYRYGVVLSVFMALLGACSGTDTVAVDPTVNPSSVQVLTEDPAVLDSEESTALLLNNAESSLTGAIERLPVGARFGRFAGLWRVDGTSVQVNLRTDVELESPAVGDVVTVTGLQTRGRIFASQINPAAVATDVVINRVSYTGDGSSDFVELKNTGSSRVDISTWALCLRVGVYPALADLTILSGNDDRVLEPGETIQFAIGDNGGEDLNDTAADIGLYVSGPFTDPANLVDFVKWGSSEPLNGRADIAVAAEMWTEVTPGSFDFVPTAAPGEVLTFDGENGGVGPLETLSSDFANVPSGEVQPAVATDVVIERVSYVGTSDFIELTNTNPDSSIDISTWAFCLRVGLYPLLADLTILSGNDDLVLEPGETIRFAIGDNGGEDLNDTAADVGLYVSGPFTNPANLVDFVKWGSSEPLNGRADIAVTAGLWTETAPGVFDFVPTAAVDEVLTFDGENGGAGPLESLSSDFDNLPDL